MEEETARMLLGIAESLWKNRKKSKNGWIKVYMSERIKDHEWNPYYIFEKYDDIDLGNKLSIITDGDFNVKKVSVNFAKMRRIFGCHWFGWLGRKEIEVDFRPQKNRANINMQFYPSGYINLFDKRNFGNLRKVRGITISEAPPIMASITKDIQKSEGIRIISSNKGLNRTDDGFEYPIVFDSYFDLSGFHQLVNETRNRITSTING